MLVSSVALGNAHAGGFYVSEIGTPGSLGTAGVANPTNREGADSSWTNPAGMTGLDVDTTLVGGTQLVLPVIKFDASIATAGGKDGSQAGLITPIPSFFVVKKLSERARFGFSVVAPLGGGLDYGNSFVGRYSANKATLQGVGLSPSFSYAINDRLSIGAGVSLVYSKLDQEISILQPGGLPDGEVSFDEFDDIGYQGFAGLIWQVTDRTRIGVVYRSEAEVDLEGDIDVRSNVLPISGLTGVKLAWDNPQLVEVGVRFKLNDTLTLVANADWEDWSAFSQNRLSVSAGPVTRIVTLNRNWKDTWHVGVGLLKKLNDHAYSIGFSYDSSPVSDANRTFDLPLDEQIKFSAAMLRSGSGPLDYAFGATLIWGGDGEVDQTSQGVRAAGEFDRNWLLFLGATLRYEF